MVTDTSRIIVSKRQGKEYLHHRMGAKASHINVLTHVHLFGDGMTRTVLTTRGGIESRGLHDN
jgi:hypothetical protein